MCPLAIILFGLIADQKHDSQLINEIIKGRPVWKFDCFQEGSCLEKIHLLEATSITMSLWIDDVLHE
jgi:hypothetical protein